MTSCTGEEGQSGPSVEGRGDGGREQVSVQVIRETSKDGQVMRDQESRQMKTKGEGRQVSGAVRRQVRPQVRAGK